MQNIQTVWLCFVLLDYSAKCTDGLVVYGRQNIRTIWVGFVLVGLPWVQNIQTVWLVVLCFIGLQTVGLGFVSLDYSPKYTNGLFVLCFIGLQCKIFTDGLCGFCFIWTTLHIIQTVWLCFVLFGLQCKIYAQFWLCFILFELKCTTSTTKLYNLHCMYVIGCPRYINSSPPGQHGRQFSDDIFRCIFVNEKCCILIKISLKFVPNSPNDKNPALV